MPPLGFVLLTHHAPRQCERLVKRLTQMFDAPPIAQHHDFSKCDLPLDRWPANVQFVRPHLETGWGAHSVVEGTVRALELLYGSGEGPQWFVLLSSNHYPIKTAARILEDLKNSQFDAHIRCKLVSPAHGQKPPDDNYWERYYVKKLQIPGISRRGLRKRPVRVEPPFSRFLGVPFDENFQCYRGSQWFCGNARAARAILDGVQRFPKFVAHCERVIHSEETFFQTLLANSEGLNLDREDNKCYIRFQGNTPHPDTLTVTDLPVLQASSAHFARKFEMDKDAEVYDRLDEVTG